MVAFSTSRYPSSDMAKKILQIKLPLCREIASSVKAEIACNRCFRTKILAPLMRQFQNLLAIRFCARWDSNPRNKFGCEPLLDRQMQTSSFGIRYGISSRTSVKNTLVGSPLQVYCTIQYMPFSRKKSCELLSESAVFLVF